MVWLVENCVIITNAPINIIFIPGSQRFRLVCFVFLIQVCMCVCVVAENYRNINQIQNGEKNRKEQNRTIIVFYACGFFFCFSSILIWFDSIFLFFTDDRRISRWVVWWWWWWWQMMPINSISRIFFSLSSHSLTGGCQIMQKNKNENKKKRNKKGISETKLTKKKCKQHHHHHQWARISCRFFVNHFASSFPADLMLLVVVGKKNHKLYRRIFWLKTRSIQTETELNWLIKKIEQEFFFTFLSFFSRFWIWIMYLLRISISSVW